MAKAPSFKTQPWTSFDRMSFSMINDDFVHDKPLTVKTSASNNSSAVKLKYSLLNKYSNLRTNGQIKFWFPLKQDKFLYSHIKNDRFKLHFDNGLIQHSNRKYNSYFSYADDRKFGNSCFKLGFTALTTACKMDLRLKYLKKEQNLTFYNKANYSSGAWKLCYLKVFDLSNLILKKSAVCIGHSYKTSQCFIRLENDGWRQNNIKLYNPLQWFDTMILNYIRRDTSGENCLGFEASISKQGKMKELILASEHKFQQKTLRLRLSSTMNLGLSLKNAIGSYGSYIFGMQISNFGSKNNIRCGLEVDLNL